ncbi:hypothetical protein [Kitasatospora sp. LaBMicrA B282]|uniref:hypothetical protein n=1 Tax=Kitasatospora sp. LaBMicrA B282 TaxID=3420949 RepID=UPI003D13A091
MTPSFRQTTTTRGIPAMRPSYDGEHPIAPTPTPIYDELYSEYRRLFRALPGDRAGEEDLRFTGFAVRERHFGAEEHRLGYGYGHGALPPTAGSAAQGQLPQHQSFPSYVGQLPGTPQFVPGQQQAAHHPYQQAHQAHPAHQTHQGHQNHQAPQYQATHYPQAAQHAHLHAQHAQHQQQPASGQGWVATGYLTPAVPSPGVPAPTTPGRHRGNLLSLPPGRA